IGQGGRVGELEGSCSGGFEGAFVRAIDLGVVVRVEGDLGGAERLRLLDAGDVAACEEGLGGVLQPAGRTSAPNLDVAPDERAENVQSPRVAVAGESNVAPVGGVVLRGELDRAVKCAIAGLGQVENMIPAEPRPEAVDDVAVLEEQPIVVGMKKVAAAEVGD